jgi:hypothetical protein
MANAFPALKPRISGVGSCEEPDPATLDTANPLLKRAKSSSLSAFEPFCLFLMVFSSLLKYYIIYKKGLIYICFCLLIYILN